MDLLKETFGNENTTCINFKKDPETSEDSAVQSDQSSSSRCSSKDKDHSSSSNKDNKSIGAFISADRILKRFSPTSGGCGGWQDAEVLVGCPIESTREEIMLSSEVKNKENSSKTGQNVDNQQEHEHNLDSQLKEKSKMTIKTPTFIKRAQRVSKKYKNRQMTRSPKMISESNLQNLVEESLYDLPNESKKVDELNSNSDASSVSKRSHVDFRKQANFQASTTRPMSTWSASGQANNGNLDCSGKFSLINLVHNLGRNITQTPLCSRTQREI